MKKYIFILSLVLFSCGKKEPSTPQTIDPENSSLEEFQSQKVAYTQQIKTLTQDLDRINSILNQLSGNEKRALVTAFEVKPELFNHQVEVQANVKTRQNLDLYPEFNGRLQQILTKEGQSVKKGALLAVIENAGMSDQLDQMKLQLDLAKTTFERTQRLWKQKIGSEMMFLEAQTRYKAQQKQVIQMEKQLAKTKVYAPFDGIIDEVFVNKGANLMAGMTPILRIVNLNNMYVESDMPENYLASIRIGSPATVSIPVLSETQTTTIRQTGNFIQPNNRTFRVEAAIQNPNKIIKPNLNARLSIVDYSNPEALMIPLRVIRENANGDPYVFILINGQTEADQNVQQRFITLGKSKNEKVEILAGIEAGELIIDEGVSLLVNDQKVTLIED